MCTECATPIAVSRVGALVKLMPSFQPTAVTKATTISTLRLTTASGPTTPTKERKKKSRMQAITSEVTFARTWLSLPMMRL